MSSAMPAARATDDAVRPLVMLTNCSAPANGSSFITRTVEWSFADEVIADLLDDDLGTAT